MQILRFLSFYAIIVRRRKDNIHLSDFPVKLPSSWRRILYVQLAMLFILAFPGTFDIAQTTKIFLWRAFVVTGLFYGKVRASLSLCIMLILAFWAVPARTEMVYDCSSAKTAVATYSLDEIGECPDFKHTYRNKTLMRAQILQRAGSQLIEGFQCQLTYQRKACYCGALHARKFRHLTYLKKF